MVEAYINKQEYIKREIALYVFGSQVYGVAGENSDTDYISIDAVQKEPERKIATRKTDTNVYSKEKFEQMLAEHDISALECMFLPEEFIVFDLHEIKTPEIDLAKLRKSISKTASNSFVKCKKKLQVEKEYYIGKKSLWHSLRILMFGIQIAKHGKIVDYQEANPLWNEIVLNPNNDWEFYKDKYKPMYNALSTEFRKVAPKDVNRCK